MKKGILILLVLLIFSGQSFASSYSGQISTWAKPMVNRGISENLINKDLTKNYQNNITRAEFCKLLVHFYVTHGLGSNIDNEIAHVKSGLTEKNKYLFKDVDYEKYDSNYIILSNVYGFISGTSNNTFLPNDKLTREQAAKIIFNVYKGYLNSEAFAKMNYDDIYANKNKKTITKFADDEDISAWAKEDVYKIKNLGIMSGAGDNKFKPKSLYTREQAIVTMVNMYDIALNEYNKYSLNDEEKDNNKHDGFENELDNGDESVKKKGNVQKQSDSNIEQIDITEQHSENEKIEKMKEEVFELTNNERRKYGLKPFSYCSSYAYYADIRAKEIGKVMGHERPDGSTFFSGMSGYKMVAENVAGGQKTPQEVVDAWMNSKGHRANILENKLEEMAVGISYSDHGWDWVQIFYTPSEPLKD